MNPAQNIAQPSEHWRWRLLLWAAIAVAFTSWSIQYSYRHGRLIAVPGYAYLYVRQSTPREPITPAVQVSKRSVNFASRRFYLSSWFLVNLRNEPIRRYVLAQSKPH